MRLNPATTPSIENPTEAQIAEALADEQNEFIILEDDDAGAFMQAAGGSDGRFVVEYTEARQETPGGMNIAREAGHRQYQTAEDQSLEQAVQLLSAWSRRDTSYKTDVAWTDITEEIHGQSPAAGLIVLAIIAALAAVALYLYFTR